MANVYSSSSEQILEQMGLYTHNLLEMLEITRPLAGQFAQTQDALRVVFEARKEADREVQRKRGAVLWHERMLDMAVRSFHRDFLDLVMNNRRNKTYSLFFPDGLTGYTYKGRSKKIQLVMNYLENLENDGPQDLADNHVDPLGKALDNFQTAQESYKQAQSDYNSARNRENAAQTRWEKDYHKLEADLLKLFDADKGTVSTFFLKSPYGRKKKDVESEPPVEETAIASSDGSDKGGP